jgi:hypothetical protein
VLAEGRMHYVPIPVVPSDVFITGRDALVVIDTNGIHATCVYSKTGKRTRIQKQRLQEEYARAGGIEARRALKNVGKL